MGDNKLRTITKTYYAGAHGIILIYDITDESSFKSIRNWLNEKEKNTFYANVFKILVGNKCDREDRTVT